MNALDGWWEGARFYIWGGELFLGMRGEKGKEGVMIDDRCNLAAYRRRLGHIGVPAEY